MSRAAAKNAQNQLNTTNNLGNLEFNKSQDLYTALEPQLQSEAQNPQGYAPADLNAMRTASNQAIGGATAGITGQGNLEAARTRNSAGLSTALDKSGQQAMQTASQNELGIEAQNANLKQAQQQSALSALGGLYGTNTGASEAFYGQGVPAINAQTNASPGWVQSLSGFLGALGGLGGGVGAAAKGIGGGG